MYYNIIKYWLTVFLYMKAHLFCIVRLGELDQERLLDLDGIITRDGVTDRDREEFFLGRGPCSTGFALAASAFSWSRFALLSNSRANASIGVTSL